MRTFAFALTSIALITTIDPAGAQGYSAPYANAANGIPGTAGLPGYRWREQRAADDWRNNTWRDQRIKDDWRYNTWQEQRARADWRQRETYFSECGVGTGGSTIETCQRPSKVPVKPPTTTSGRSPRGVESAQ
jgi:hypothetical protein